MEADNVRHLPILELAQWRFLLSQPDDICPNKAQLKDKLMESIIKENMTPFYLLVCEELKWPVDKDLAAKMQRANEEKLKQLEDNIKDAVENLGESEVREANLAKAEYLNLIGDKKNAENQYRITEEKTVGAGQKMDIVFTVIRMGFFWNDNGLLTRNLEKAKGMIEAVGDWDRKNRLKVYEGLYCLYRRDFAKSANLLLETISTFTATELFDYTTFIFYTVLMSIVSLDRVSLKKKVLDSPEVLAVINDVPHLNSLLTSFYNSSYAQFFVSLAEITDVLKTNRYAATHAGYFCKEMRVAAYSQLLESYRSVQLESMARAFGVSEDFLDRELSRFIASGRLHCKIDKVGGIVVTNRPDSSNAQYLATIKHGDLLLNRVQKLSRVINL